MSHAIFEEGLDSCGHICEHFLFCKSCVNDIGKPKLPQFGSMNKIDIYTCHSYLAVFQDLMLVEKAVIIRAYLIITIIKLRASSANVFAIYP